MDAVGRLRRPRRNGILLAALLPGSWTVSHHPAVVIGSDERDGNQNLHRVVGAVALSDGRVVVGSGAEPMLRWYDAAGDFVAGAVQAGGGPGELQTGWIHRFWPLPGDSVAVWEHAVRRMQVFGPDGRFARSVVLELPQGLLVGSYPTISGWSPEGLVVHLPPLRADGHPVGERWRDSAAYLYYRPDGTFGGAIAELPFLEMFQIEVRFPFSAEALPTEGRPPFARGAATAVHGDRFYHGDQETYEVAVYGLDGALRTRILKDVPNRPVTAAIRRADRERRLETDAVSGDGSSRVETVRPRIEDLPYPATLPAYWSIRVDRDGWLWVQEYVLPGEETAYWSVFDPDGRWVTDVEIPTAWRIQEIGRDYVLAVVRTPLEVEHVKRFALAGRG